MITSLFVLFAIYMVIGFILNHILSFAKLVKHQNRDPQLILSSYWIFFKRIFCWPAELKKIL